MRLVHRTIARLGATPNVYRLARAFGVARSRAALLAARYALTGSTGRYSVNLSRK